MQSIATTSQAEIVSARNGVGPITIRGAGSDAGIGDIMKSDVGTPMRRRNLKSPMILQERGKFRTPHARSGSVDQVSPLQPQNDPVRQLLRKLKHEKGLREKAIRERQLNQMKEIEAINQQETRKFEEL